MKPALTRRHPATSGTSGLSQVLPQIQSLIEVQGATVTVLSGRASENIAAEFASWVLEQTRIVAEVERRSSVAEELKSVVSANLQRDARLRQFILQQAFAGDLL